MIASINVHIAAILFFSSTMLLAIVHRNLLGGNDIPIVIFSMFLFISHYRKSSGVDRIRLI
ncbi:MAG: hypothetical protein BECKG1743D_GA0114223_100704 [Candidatus Kentron sp. G]|nr:MAG: hypothetical protein BECKG1743D_GA0114223_100704 [Candidatus Kentron sp. G]